MSLANEQKTSVVRKPIAIVEAPCNLGLRPPHRGKEPGVHRLAEVLTADGLPKEIGAVSATRVNPPPYQYRTERGDGVKNAKAIYQYSLELSVAVGRVLDAAQFPLVLGADCSILLGNLLALRRRGRYGLVYLDAHSDTDLPTFRHLTAAGGSDIATATGQGTSVLTSLDNMKPLVRDEDTVLFGCLEYLDIKGTQITPMVLSQVRRNGIKAEISKVLSRFRTQQLRGFWIHLDADVLDGAIMSAVDSPHEDGMGWDELRETLHGFLESGMVAGMEVTIYDPDLDPSGEMGRKFAKTIATAFRASAFQP